jgi:hypothetical protein
MKFKNYKDWSDEFTRARKMVGQNDLVLELWKAEVPGEWKREQWDGDLGYRKNSKPGAEDSGEKLLEQKLLGKKGELKDWFLINGNVTYKLKTVYSNFPLIKPRPGQVLSDVFAVLNVSGRWHPLLVEVKTTDGGPWYALVECLKQMVLARKNKPSICRFLKQNNISATAGAWGLVVAPKEFWSNKRYKTEMDKCNEFMKILKKETTARICFATIDVKSTELKLIWQLGNWS